jgi:mannose-6-phosphate isomerase-like protein (cupin superfamily)
VLVVIIKRIHLHGYLRIGSTIMKKDYGDLFITSFEEDQVKVKELIVAPGKGMSFQKHFKRSEIWLVSKGSCIVNYSKDNPDNKENIRLNKFDHYLVPLGEWHQITNPFEETCHLIEIQYGDECVEDDIERTEYYQEK